MEALLHLALHLFEPDIAKKESNAELPSALSRMIGCFRICNYALYCFVSYVRDDGHDHVLLYAGP